MIPTILFLLLRKYRKVNPDAADRIMRFVLKTSRILFLCFLLLSCSLFTQSQELSLTYAIKRKGSEVGTLNIHQVTTGNKLSIRLVSQVRARFIFLFTAKTKEEVEFENDVMTFSYFYRKMNGNEKINKRTTLQGRSYFVQTGSGSQSLHNYPINYTTLSLYTREPIHISKVYSDNYQQLLDIEKIGDHHYQIKFPDGNSCEYFYREGIINRIKVHHSMFSVSIELKS